MSRQNTAKLALPYIQPAQAQKHVTHNEAIRVLDALVQGAVPSPPRNVPPATAAEGTLYVIADTPADEWAGHAGELAWRTDGAWSFLVPKAGWSFRVISTGAVAVYDGSDWDMQFAGGLPDQVSLLGIGATADTTNRLSVGAEATLLSNAGAGHQVKVNKAAETDTASLLFQTGFSGRAEMGTSGDDDFAVKVSADGTTWATGLSIDAGTGRVSFPAGARIANRVELGGRIACETDNRWVTADITGSYARDAGTGTTPALDWTQAGPLIPAGTELAGLRGALRATDAEVSALDLQVYLQTGPWDAGWASDGDTSRVQLATLPGIDLTGGQVRIDIDLGGHVTAADGYLLIFARPVGTLSAGREVIASLSLSMVGDD